MQREDFWRIIGASKDGTDGRFDARAEALQDRLAMLDAEDIVEFDDLYHQYMNQADTWDLWGAAYIIGGGCSDDGFLDFRSWLISMGQDVFERALADPETLAAIELGTDAEEDVFFEEFAYVASAAYQQKTATEMPRRSRVPYEGTRGEPWEEDELAERFPRLWAKYGDS